MSSLAHHGVKGQKWGVRRYQNPDGTRTAEGKKQLKASRIKRTNEDVRDIYKSLSDRDLELLAYSKEEIKRLRETNFTDRIDGSENDTVHRVVKRDKNGTPVSYVDATQFTSDDLETGKKMVHTISLDIATRGGDEFRGKGYAVAAGKQMVRWFDRYGFKNYDHMEWFAKADNVASQKTAEKIGFKKMDYVYDWMKNDGSDGWVGYSYRHEPSFNQTTKDVKSKISNDPKPIEKQPVDIKGVMDRGKLSEADAKKCIRLADSVYKKASKEEPAITSDLTSIAKSSGFGMYGLEHRLKQPTSLAGKIGSDAKDDGVSFSESANGIKDAVRYTTVSDNKNFVFNYNKVKSELEAKGYEEVRCKNFFEKYRAGEVQHKAVQTTFKSPTGYEFELQFQTPESQAAKELKIPIYEERRKQGISESRAKQLEQEMHDLAEQVPYPKGIETIQSHNKLKHSSIGGNMNYIYGNTLVLGDSSYLEHHGIKNQKWGIRRFQNSDGSLTAAGRIRYGVTGAAKAAFKVGKKLGSATASAARAGVKKAKDNAYAKKKEKASQTREGVLKNKKMFTNEELERLEKRFKIEDDMRNAGLRHGQEIAKTISAYGDAAVKTMNALQTGGKAVKAISDGLSALKDYKEKRDISKKASDAGMSTADYKEYTKAKTSEKTSDKPPNDDNPPNNGGGGGSKKQVENEAKRQAAQEAIYAKRKADLDSRESGLKQREDYVNKRYDALLKVSKQRQSEQDARDEDLNRRDKAASEREAKLKETAKTAADVMSKLNKRQADLDKKESFLNSIESYRLDTLSEFKKNEEEAARRKKKNAKHSAIGEEMYTDHLEHHGIKGQRWGVRRFQNADGSLTDKGRKHYQKKLALEERKLTAANAARGQYERVRTPMSVGMGILGAVAGAMVGVPAGPAGIAAGAAIVSSIAASSNYAAYTVAGIVAGHGAKRNMKKIAKYKEALAQDAFEIQNGVLIYGSGQSCELKHFGLKGMKWGVQRFQNKDGSLTDAGKKRYSNTGELDSGGGGGGSDEEDEETKKKIEEAAKKAGMTVADYRKKFADKIAAMKKKDRSWKYDSSISTKDMRRMAKDSAESTERLSKKAHEAAMAQNSALRAGNKKRASTHGWAATQYNTLAKNEQTGGRYSAKNVKRNYDSTLEGKATKLRYATQRAKQRVYNAAGGKYKEEANTASVYREREKAKENRAIKAGNQYDAEAARSWQDLYSQSEKAMNSAYRKSVAGRYDALKAKRKKKSAKHSAIIEDGALRLKYHGINFPKR